MKETQQIIDSIKQREPIFHQEELCNTQEKLESYCTEDFWEVGASGNIYKREEVIETVLDRFQNGKEVDTSQWKVSNFQCKQISDNAFLATYTLDQNGRLTRRSSLWSNKDGNLRVQYHQGTLI